MLFRGLPGGSTPSISDNHNFRSSSCEQTTEQSRTLECNRNSRGEKSGQKLTQNEEKSGMRGEKSGENGEKYCMVTRSLSSNASRPLDCEVPHAVSVLTWTTPLDSKVQKVPRLQNMKR